MKAAKTTKKRTNSAWWNSKEGRKWREQRAIQNDERRIASQLSKWI